MMLRYLNLRLSQQVLCYTYSLPLALFFTFAFSPVGTWSWPLFFSLFVLLTALGWADLAFQLRRLDRLRRGFPPDCFHDELLLRAKKLAPCSSQSHSHSSHPSLGEEK